MFLAINIEYYIIIKNRHLNNYHKNHSSIYIYHVRIILRYQLKYIIIIEFKLYYNYYNYITICNANRNKISI